MTQQNNEIIQDVLIDKVAGIKSFSQCITLSDALNDNNHRLICADINNKLKVFKGNTLQNEATLSYPAVGICSFYAMEPTTKAIVPYFAVGGGTYVYIYKNVKGTLKFPMPNSEIREEESKIYKEFYGGETDQKTCISKLKALINNEEEVSFRSLELVKIKGEDNQLEYLTNHKDIPIVIANYITCMETIKMYSSSQPNVPSNIIVGTEYGFVFIIDPSEKKIISKTKLPDAPYMISSLGTFDSDYKLYVVNRHYSIYVVGKNNSIASTITLLQTVITMSLCDKGIYLATTGRLLQCLSLTGKELYAVIQPANISALELVQYSYSQYVLLAIKNNEVRLYKEKTLIYVIPFKDNVFAMKFGRYGTTDNSMVFITNSGGLIIKAIGTDKSLDSLKMTTNASSSSEKKEEGNLVIPKKTPLYLDLIEREKEIASDMQNTFQNDLLRLRYKAMDTHANMLKIGNAPQNYSSSSPMKLSASLQGLGPDFKLVLTIGNVKNEPVWSSELTLDYNRTVYSFDKDNIQLGLIMPNISVKYCLSFKNISDAGSSGMIKIIIVDKNKTIPLIQTTVKVPISELEIM